MFSIFIWAPQLSSFSCHDAIYFFRSAPKVCRVGKLVIPVPPIDDGQKFQVFVVSILDGMSSLGQYFVPPLASWSGWDNDRIATHEFVAFFLSFFVIHDFSSQESFGYLTNLSHILSYSCSSLRLRGLPSCQLSRTMMCVFPI